MHLASRTTNHSFAEMVETITDTSSENMDWIMKQSQS